MNEACINDSYDFFVKIAVLKFPKMQRSVRRAENSLFLSDVLTAVLQAHKVTFSAAVLTAAMQ